MFRKKSVLANVLIISMLISTFAFGYTPYEAHGADTGTQTQLSIFEGHNDVSTSYYTEISTDFGTGFMSSYNPYANMYGSGTYSLVDGKLTDGNGHYLELTTGEITGFYFGNGGVGSCTKNAQTWLNRLILTVKKTHTQIQIDRMYDNTGGNMSVQTYYNLISTDKGEAYSTGTSYSSYYTYMFDSGKYSIVNGRLEDGSGHYFMVKGYEITGFCFGTASSGDDCTRNSKQFSNSKISIKVQQSHASNNVSLYEGSNNRTSACINKVSTDYGVASTTGGSRVYMYSSGTYKIENGKLTDGNGHYLEVDGYEITGFNFGTTDFTTDPKEWTSGNLYIQIKLIYAANNMYLYNTSGTSMSIVSYYNLISTDKGAAYGTGTSVYNYYVDMFNSGKYEIKNGRLENESGHYLEMDGYEITGFSFYYTSYSDCKNESQDYSNNTNNRIALIVKPIYTKMRLYVYSGTNTTNVVNTFYNKISTDKGAAYTAGSSSYLEYGVDMFNSGTYKIKNGRLENESGHYLEVDGCEIIGFGFNSSNSSCTSDDKSLSGSNLSIKVQETYSKTTIQGIYEGTSTSTMQIQNILAYISTDKGAAYNSGSSYYVDMFNSGKYEIKNGRLENGGHYLEIEGYNIIGFYFGSGGASSCTEAPKDYSTSRICLKVEKIYTGTMIRVYGETGSNDITEDFYNKISTEKGAAYKSGSSTYYVDMFCSGTDKYKINTVNGRLENGGHYLEVDGCEIISFAFGGSYSSCTPDDKAWASGTLSIRIKEIYKKTRIYSIYHNGGTDKKDLYYSLVSTDNGNAYSDSSYCYVDMYIGTEYKLENGRLADGSGHYLQLDGYNILGFIFNSGSSSNCTSASKTYTGSGAISLNVQPSCDKTQLFIYENGVNSDKASTYYNKISTDVAKAYVNSSLCYADMYVSGTYSIVDGKLTDGKGHYLEIDGAKIIGFYFGGNGVSNCSTAAKTWQNRLAINIGLSYKISYTGMSGATHGTNHPETVYTSETFTVNNPTKSGYHFNGWNITGMSSGSHTVGGTTVSGTSKDNVKGTSFKDLNSNGNTVTFEATWLEDLTKPSTSGVNRNYTGSAQTINLTTPDNTTRGGTYQATDAGTYTATYTPNPGYCWSDGTTGAVNVDWQILKVAATTTTTPVLASSKTYTGSAQNLLSNAGATSTGTLKYCVTTSTSTSTPADSLFGTTYSATNAGTYYVWYYVAGDANHSDTTKTRLGPIKINNADITVTANNQSYTYNGTAQGIAITATTKGSQTATITYGTTSGSCTSTTVPTATTVADSKTIYYKVTAPNHNDKTGSYTLTITKASGATTTTPVVVTNLTYTGSAQNLLSSAGATSTGTLKYSVTTNSGDTAPADSEFGATYKATSADTYYVWYYVSADANHNNTTKTKLGPVVIKKADITVSASDQSYTYTGSAQGHAISVTTVGSQTATIKYGVTSGDCTSSTVPKATNVADSKTIYYKVTAPNHNDKTGSYKLTITGAAASAEAPVTATNLTYTGSAQNLLSSAGTTSTGTLKYSVTTNSGDTAPAENTFGASYAATSADTYYVWYYVSADANHNNTTKTKLGPVVIKKADITVSASDQSYTYTGSAQGHAISVTTVGSQTATITYGTTSGSYTTETVPTATNVAESKTIYYKVTAPNHNDKTGSYKLTITGAAASAEAPVTATNLTYTGSAQNLLSSAGTTSTGTLKYSVTTNSGDTAPADSEFGTTYKATSADTYYVWYYVSADANHNSTTKTKLGPVTINKATPTVTAPVLKTGNQQYRGTPIDACETPGSTTVGTLEYCLTTDNSATAPTGGWSSTAPVASAVGTYYLWYRVIGNSNYNDVNAAKLSSTLKVEFGKFTLQYNLAGGTGVSDDSVYYNEVGKVTTAEPNKVGFIFRRWNTSADGSGSDVAAETLWHQANGASQEYDVLYAIYDKYVDKPTAPSSVVYNGTVQTIGVTTPAGISADGEITATNVGEYTVTYTPGDGYCWPDGEKTPVEIKWEIIKADNPIASPADQTWDAGFSADAQTKELQGFTSAEGNVSYTISGDSHFSISGNILTMQGSTPLGSYELTVTGTTTGNENYESATKTFNVEITVTDKSAPTELSIVSTDLNDDSQTVKFSGNDDIGITKYYFGTSDNSAPNKEWTGNNEETVSAEGIYYLVVQDDAGNESSANITFYLTSFSVTNGSVNISKILKESGKNIELPAITANTGYTAPDKWSNGVEPYHSYMVTADAALTAVCTENTYNLVYELDGGTGDSSSSAKYTEVGRVTNTPPTKACHTFIEWNTQANGEGQTVSADAIWKNADSVSLIYDKLYAIWDENNPTVSAEPTIKDSMVYTSLGNVLITPAEVVNGTSYYAIGTDGTTVPSAEAWSTDIPRKVDAGTYHVWWMVSGDADYLDVPPKYIGEATIDRLTLTNSNFGFNGSFTYDGTAHEISGGSIAFDCSYVDITIYDLMISSYEDNVNAGTHKAYVALTPNGPSVHNYIIEPGTYILFTIKKAEQTIAANEEQIFTYGDTGKSISASAEGTLSYTVVSGDSVTVDEATGALDILKTGDTKIKISAEATSNYKSASKEITVRIQTSKISKPSADATEFTYTGSELTYEPSEFDSSKMEISGNINTNAGTYQVTVTPKSGYEWSDGGDCTFTWVIAKAEQTITADSLQGFLTSDTDAYVVASAEGTLSYTVVSGNSVAVNSNTGELTINHTGETTIKISADATINYNEASKQIKVRIVAEKLEKPSADAREFIYTGSEQTYEPDGFVDSKMEISGNAKTNAGTYEVTVTPKPDYAWNEPGDCTFEWVIKKAEQTISADALQIFTYGETGEFISASAEGTLSYSVVSGSSVEVDPNTGGLTINHTGETTINISAEATQNYKAATKEITVRIQTAQISKPSADATEFTYTGSEQTYEPGGFDSSKMEISGNKNTNAGTYNVTVTPKSGYEWSDGGDCIFEWVIKKAEQTITANDEQTFTYGDAGESISASAEGTLSYTVVSGDSVTVNPNTGELTINHTGETKVNISAEATSNYKAVSKEITITIQRAEQTITAENPQNFEFGAVNPQLIASAEGTISYQRISGDAVDVSSNGELTINSTGDAEVRVTAAETQNYNSNSIDITVRVSTSISHVTLNTNEGECAPLTTYIEGTGTTLPVPTREGYDFNGWFTNAECTGNAVTQIEADDTGDLEFWAKWTAKTFTIANATPEASAASSNGYLEVSSNAVYRGMVTVKVFPNSGYELESLQYTASDDSVQTIEKTANEYTFEMPAKDITVSATFKEKQVPDSGGNNPTTDQTTDPQNNVDTASVTIGNMSIQVDMLVENGIANISEIGKEDIEKALRTADKISNINTLNIEIKNNEVIGVKLTVSTLKNIVEILESKENSINAFEIGMQEAIVNLDSKALKAIKDQAVGNNVIIVVTETNAGDINSNQNQALAKHEVYRTFDVRAESDGTTIHNFNGGKAIVKLKFSPEQGREGKNYKVYYANDGGKLQKMATKYAKGTIKFATTHFSDFAIVYDTTQEILLLKGNAKGKKVVKLSWNKIENAEKHVIYGARCGNEYKKLKTTTGKSYTVKKMYGKKLLAQKYYKFYVVSYDKVGNKYMSRCVHLITGNTGKVYANVKSIKAKSSKFNLNVGENKKVSAEYEMYHDKKHIKNTHGATLKYYSNNPEVAKVNSKGKVTAISPGTATIYIQDIGGKYCKTKVIVK